MSAVQLKNKLIGRLFNAAGRSEAKLPARLHDALLGDPHGLRARLPFPMAFWPGPLEGGLGAALQPPPEDLRAALETGLEGDRIEPETLILFINLGTTFTLSDALLERVVDKIGSAGIKFLASVPPDDVQTHLLGLAYVAASHRNIALADSVHFFVRHLRGHSAPVVIDEMQLALYSAAAHEDIDQWRTFVGAWLLALSGTINDEEVASDILGWIEAMCEMDPSLRERCGRARAALRLVLNQ